MVTGVYRKYITFLLQSGLPGPPRSKCRTRGQAGGYFQETWALHAYKRHSRSLIKYFAHLERFCTVVLLGVHEAGNLGGVFRKLEGRVIDVDALHSVLDVMRNVSVQKINNM